MAATRISNRSSSPLPLPYPLRGIIPGGGNVVLQGVTVAQVIAALGGAAAAAPLLVDVLAVEPTGDEKRDDAFFAGEVAAPNALGSALAAGVQKRTISIAVAELQALDPGVQTFTKADPKGALPDGARMLGHVITALTPFDDATDADVFLSIGVADEGDVLASLAVNEATGPRTAPFGGKPNDRGYVGVPAVGTPSLKLSTVAAGIDLNTLTDGAITVDILYFIG